MLLLLDVFVQIIEQLRQSCMQLCLGSVFLSGLARAVSSCPALQEEERPSLGAIKSLSAYGCVGMICQHAT